MTPSKAAALSTRSFDSFNIFKDPEYITGIQGLGTVQPLVDDREEGLAYFGIKEENWKTCKWTATEKDFEKGSVLFDEIHVFGSRKKERMHKFISPRIQIIHASNILVVDDYITDPKTGNSKNIIVGDLSMEGVKEAFEKDQKAQQKALLDNKPYNRQYSTRTKYLVNILTKENKPAHEVPMVLTLKGLASVDLSDKIKEFQVKMDKCLSAAQGLGSGVKFDKRVKSLYVFIPTLTAQIKGSRKNEICAVESVRLPEYTDQESAQAEIIELTVPDEAREKTWAQLEDSFLGDYINRHSAQEAAKLHGAYGTAEGVPALLPQGSVQVLPAELSNRKEDTGELEDGLLA